MALQDYDEILRQVKGLRDDCLLGIMSKNDLHDKYPLLSSKGFMFESVFRDHSDEKIVSIERMVEQAKLVQDNVKTKEQASTEVGEALAEKYLYPKFPKRK